MAKNKVQNLNASSFKDGTLLEELARSHVNVFRPLLPEHHKPLYGRRTWGTLCSGSEGAHYVMEAAEQSMREWNAASGQEPLKLEQLFACESVAIKRKWIHHVVNVPRLANGHQGICIFCDIQHMNQSAAYCETHDKQCVVPDVDILIVSTSCKDLSLLSSAARKFNEPVLGMTTSPGGSADTFAGFLAYLDSHTASMVIYENSEQMVDDYAAPQEKTNEDVFNATMSSRFYEGNNFIINAKLYGLPQSRRRFFAVYIKTVMGIVDYSTRTVLDQLATLTMLLQCCKRGCPAARGLLLADDDLDLQSELLKMLERPERITEKQTWPLDHQKEYVKVCVRWGEESPCEATKNSPWLPILNAYQRSLLTLNQHRVLGKKTRLYSARQAASGQKSAEPTHERRPFPVLMIDVRPSASRLSTSTYDEYCQQELAPCIVPDQRLWLHIETPRPMLGREAMLFQGWPISLVAPAPWVTDSLLYGLAGNAVACPVLLALFMAAATVVSTIATGAVTMDPWNDEDEADQDSALSLFAALPR